MEQKGFTLIELVVVMAVFLIIAGTALGIFISIVQHQKKVLAQQELLNQASYAVEHISKGLRMARTADNSDCIESGLAYEISGDFSSIKFINQSESDLCQQFFITPIDQNNLNLGYVLEEIRGSENPVKITSASLKINSLKFILNGGQGLVAGQPRVTMLLDIENSAGYSQPLKIQTTVSQRNLNQ